MCVWCAALTCRRHVPSSSTPQFQCRATLTWGPVRYVFVLIMNSGRLPRSPFPLLPMPLRTTRLLTLSSAGFRAPILYAVCVCALVVCTRAGSGVVARLSLVVVAPGVGVLVGEVEAWRAVVTSTSSLPWRW